MPKLDGLKEDLSLLRFWLGISVASFLAIIGWLVTNYNNAQLWLIISASLLLLAFAVIVFLINKRMRNIIKQIYQHKKEE